MVHFSWLGLTFLQNYGHATLPIASTAVNDFRLIRNNVQGSIRFQFMVILLRFAKPDEREITHF